MKTKSFGLSVIAMTSVFRLALHSKHLPGREHSVLKIHLNRPRMLDLRLVVAPEVGW